MRLKQNKTNQPFYLCCDFKHFSRIPENFCSIKACKHGVYFPQEWKNLLIFASVLNCKLNKATRKGLAKVTAHRLCKTPPCWWGRCSERNLQPQVLWRGLGSSWESCVKSFPRPWVTWMDLFERIKSIRRIILSSRLCESESEVAQSYLTLCDPWTVAHQAPPSMGFSRQESWSGLPFPSPGYIETSYFVLKGYTYWFRRKKKKKRLIW